MPLSQFVLTDQQLLLHIESYYSSGIMFVLNRALFPYNIDRALHLNVIPPPLPLAEKYWERSLLHCPSFFFRNRTLCLYTALSFPGTLMSCLLNCSTRKTIASTEFLGISLCNERCSLSFFCFPRILAKIYG
jgi:hypothetical protein